MTTATLIRELTPSPAYRPRRRDRVAVRYADWLILLRHLERDRRDRRVACYIRRCLGRRELGAADRRGYQDLPLGTRSSRMVRELAARLGLDVRPQLPRRGGR